MALAANKSNHSEWKRFLKGIAFIGPNYLGFILFTLLPVIFALFLAFCDWNVQQGLSGLKFIGLANFKELVTDVWFIDSLKNNFVFTIVSVPLIMAFALVLAVLLNKYVLMKKTLRTLFFLPYVTNIVVVCYIWMMLFQPTYGPINGFLRSLGLANPPGWLGDSHWALHTITMMNVWIYTGYSMVIYLAGLQGIPQELNEAAAIDGATGIKSFFHITLPLLSPTTFFILITSIINSFKVFAPISIMTDGGPGTSTTVLVYHIYISAFRFFRMGYASAIACVLFMIVFVITYLQWLGQKKWVDYM